MPTKQPATVLEPDCLHVAPSDDPFTARMRLHQSWYRRHALQLPPGPNPAAGGKSYGNMLRPQDGKEGWNFLSNEIYAELKKRFPNGKESGRMRTNMLSSQPMCFNLFGPLTSNKEWATHLVRKLPGVPRDLQVTGVQFEYAPDPKTHLNDKTSFDAFITYKRGTAKGFIGIETKLTEPFSQEKYSFGHYSRFRSPEWWWRDSSESAFSNPAYNQLWRNQLLSFSMLKQKRPEYTEGYCAVVYHPEDVCCPDAAREYRKHLKASAGASLLEWRLDVIVACWKELMATREHKEWLAAFRLRYLDLAASAPAWDSL